MITKNDEVGLAAIDEKRRDGDMRAWCRIENRSVVCIRIRVPLTTVIPRKVGDDVWVWADTIDAAGDLQSKVYGHIPAACFEVVGRISEKGE